MRSKLAISLIQFTVLALATAVVMAQSTTKQVNVTFAQAVVVGETTLPPGDYTFKEVSDRVIQVFDKDTMRAEAAVMAISTERSQPSEDTKVILSKYDTKQNFYVEKIWIQGRATGFEFVMPDSIKSLKEEREEAIAGKYEERKSDEKEGLK